MLGSNGRPFEVSQTGTIVQVSCASAELASKLMLVLKPLLERAALPTKVKPK